MTISSYNTCTLGLSCLTNQILRLKNDAENIDVSAYDRKFDEIASPSKTAFDLRLFVARLGLSQFFDSFFDFIHAR